MNYNRIRFANRAAGEVRRLVQVGQRRVVRQLRPKCLDHLIAMQPMTTCQRKDLHQLRSTTMLPSLLRHKATISHDLKTAQQPNLKTLHQETIFAPNDGARKSAKSTFQITLSTSRPAAPLHPTSCRANLLRSRGATRRPFRRESSLPARDA